MAAVNEQFSSQSYLFVILAQQRDIVHIGLDFGPWTFHFENILSYMIFSYYTS